ncbi:2-dehydropantoate 2-reductase [Shewanella sp.]|nr:2-dehydropantoate 2-reductase [Shewanella sp.]
MTDASALISHKSENQIPITILGAGAIGQLIYQQLSQTDDAKLCRVNVVSRAKQSHRQLLSFTALSQQESHYDVDFIGRDDWQTQLNKTQCLIVCVKAYQVTMALLPIIEYLNPQCHIVLLHNGLGPHLEVAKHLRGQSLSLGTTSQGALKLSAWHTKQTGTGLTQLGLFTGQAMPEALKTMLLWCIPNSQWCEDILPMLWQKLAVNVAINPLTALHDCRNGELAQPQYQQCITLAVRELVLVAAAEGIELDHCALLARVYQVINLTMNNYSSMHQDLQHQRQTEITAINGFVVKMAKKHNISAKVNQQLVQRITHLEKQYLALT